MVEALTPTGGETLTSLSARDPKTAMQILAFWTFDRQEWGEIWRMEGRLVMIDLEFQFARYSSPRSFRDTLLKEHGELTGAALRYALDEAKRCQQEELFRAELRSLVLRTLAGKFVFDFHPHRWGKSIERFLAASVTTRSNALLQIL